MSDEIKTELVDKQSRITGRKAFGGFKPYNFNYNKYYGLDEISMAFANDWENATKHLYRGIVEKNIAQYGEEYANEITDLKSIEDKDTAVFSMIYVLNPQAPLCFKGVLYKSLQSLGMEMYEKRANQDENILKLISSGCLLKYVTQNNYEDNFRNQIALTTENIKSGKLDYYYALMYFLYPEAGFDFNEIKYLNLEDFVNDLEKNNTTRISSNCQQLISNKMFFMWIYSLGYSKQIIDWLKIYDKVVG